MSETVLLGRGQVLGTFREAAELSAAFGAGNEVRLALPTEGTGVLSADALAVAGRAVARLVEVIHERVDMDIWVWAFGDGPDGLATLTDARARFGPLDDAFDDASEEEAIALLALLAGGTAPEPRVISRRARVLFGPADVSELDPCRLALRAPATEVARRFASFRARGGADLPFWTADRTLGVCFKVTRDAVSFRAHHPVIQEEMVARCASEGIDVE